MKDFTVLTYNCRGLNNHFKRRKLFLWLKQQKCDVILLQETFCTEKLIPFLKSNWKGKIENCLSDSSHCRGVSVLFCDGFVGTVLKKYESKDGRILIVDVKINDDMIHIVTVYAPNTETDRISFYENLSEIIVKQCDNLNNVILGGDFNTCLTKNDRYPTTNHNDKSIITLRRLLTKCTLTDTWQSKNNNKPGYTYHDKKNKCHSSLKRYKI